MTEVTLTIAAKTIDNEESSQSRAFCVDVHIPAVLLDRLLRHVAGRLMQHTKLILSKDAISDVINKATSCQ